MVNMMEWQKQVQSGNVDAMYVKVMTDEQLETLRKQIAVYATICEQLVEMHKTLSAQQDLAGIVTNLLQNYYFCLILAFNLKLDKKFRACLESLLLHSEFLLFLLCELSFLQIPICSFLTV